eukprot:scaffold11528_cov139-Cylindrotheca_fusiformis.AAC.2
MKDDKDATYRAVSGVVISQNEDTAEAFPVEQTRQGKEKSASARRYARRYLRHASCLFVTFFVILCHSTSHMKLSFFQETDAAAAAAPVFDSPDDDRRERILSALENLDKEMEGDIVLVSKKEKFQLASRVWRLGLQPPMAVIEAASQEDVAIALPILAGLSKDYQVEFRIKSGGHSYAGGSTVSDGLVLSLSKLDNLTLKLENNSTLSNSASENSTVVVEPGVNMEQFMKQVLDQNGYAGAVSVAAGVGFGGFILGGGYGHTSRMYGLAMDNIVRIRAVLVNGTTDDVFPGDDLFWALCGSGGGNFAVAIEYELQVYPSNDMKLGAKMKLPLSLLFDFLQKLGEREAELDGRFIASVHEMDFLFSDRNEMKSLLDGLQASNETATVSLHWMGDSNGDTSDQGMDYIQRNVLSLIPEAERANVLVTFYYFSWSGVTRQREQPETWNKVWGAQIWNGFLLSQNNTNKVWASIYRDMNVMFRYCTFLSPNIELWGGAISKRSSNDTAFPHRQAVYNVGVQLLVPNATENAEQVFQNQKALVNAVWPSIAKHLKGVYANYPMPSLSKEEYPREYWGDNLARLVELQEKYDPGHSLRYEQSIPAKNDSYSIGCDL